MKADSFVSVVTVVDETSFDSDSVIALSNYLSQEYSDYEILIINRDSFTVKSNDFSNNVNILLKKLPSIRFIQISGSNDLNVLYGVGLEHAMGDFIIFFDLKNDPLNIIGQSVKECREGYDVVIGLSNRSKSLAYSFFGGLARLVLKNIDYHLPKNSTQFRCLSRRAVNAATSTGKYYHQLFMRIQKTGYPFTCIQYKTLNPLAKRNIFAGGEDFFKLVIFNSFKPLRWMSILGFFGSFMSFVFATYSLISHALNGNIAPGWTTNILFMSCLFMLQFIMLSFFGEYIVRLLNSQGNSDDYAIVFEKNSLVMIDADRVNVLDSSLDNNVNLVKTGRDR